MTVWGDRRRERNGARLDALIRYADGRDAAFGDGVFAESAALALECECGRRDCDEVVAMLSRAYVAVRQAGARIVCSGHENAGDLIAAGGDGFSVVARRFVA